MERDLTGRCVTIIDDDRTGSTVDGIIISVDCENRRARVEWYDGAVSTVNLDSPTVTIH